MASDKPKLSRAGTMKTTAEEGAAFLEREGFDWRVGGSTFVDDTTAGGKKEGKNQGSEPSPKRLKRQSTMAVTAEEGAEFLQRQGYEPVSPEGTPTEQAADQGGPKVKRYTTMEVTAGEGSEFIARMQGLQGTGEKNVTFDDHVATITPPRPKLQRDSTIDVTVKEGEAFLERMGGVGQAQDGDDGERPESVEHKKNETPTRAKLQRDSTIDVTVKEGEAFLRRAGALPEDHDENDSDNDDEAVVDVRADTPEDDGDEDNGPLLKDDSTTRKNAKIAGEFVAEGTEVGSESGKPGRAPLKRAGTMDVTKAEGEEFLKRKRT